MSEENIAVENFEAENDGHKTPAEVSRPKEGFQKGKFDKGGKPENRRARDDRAKREPEEFEKVMVELRSVQKTVKGGRTLSFRALCVVGDKKGRVGVGIGKARETINAIEKGFNEAKKHVITVPIVGTTIPHEIVEKFGAASIKLLPAKEGNGVIAGGAARSVIELCGIKDVTSKTRGSRSKINTAMATYNGLKKLRTKEQIANLRDLDSPETETKAV